MDNTTIEIQTTVRIRDNNTGRLVGDSATNLVKAEGYFGAADRKKMAKGIGVNNANRLRSDYFPLRQRMRD